MSDLPCLTRRMKRLKDTLNAAAPLSFDIHVCWEGIHQELEDIYEGKEGRRASHLLLHRTASYDLVSLMKLTLKQGVEVSLPTRIPSKASTQSFLLAHGLHCRCIDHGSSHAVLSEITPPQPTRSRLCRTTSHRYRPKYSVRSIRLVEEVLAPPSLMDSRGRSH